MTQEPAVAEGGMILAGDIGGTKTRLALFELRAARLHPVREQVLASADHTGLGAAVAAFLGQERPALTAAGFGIAGPVRDNRCQTTNLPWQVDGDELGRALGLERARLLNDLAATAHGLADLAPEQIRVLQAGEADPTGVEAVIAPGTGLGMAIVARHHGEPLVLPSEGGHADLAAPGEDLGALAAWLERRHGHASIERAVSGPGLVEIHEFYVGVCGHHEEPVVRARMERGDPAAAISEAALSGESALCRRVLRLFVQALGAAAGNLALTTLATGGVWLGGGIPPRILPALEDGLFLDAFVRKGRFEPWLRRVPVRVVLEPRTALLGAARAALRARD